MRCRHNGLGQQRYGRQQTHTVPAVPAVTVPWQADADDKESSADSHDLRPQRLHRLAIAHTLKLETDPPLPRVACLSKAYVR